MNFTKLEHNIVDMIKEQQVKLGYRSESVYLFYPLGSLNRLLQTDADEGRMVQLLGAFCDGAKERLGPVEVSNQGERFCFVIPAQGADYVHAHTGSREFIVDFVNAVSRHGAAIDDLLPLFHQYSNAVHVERVSHPEFDCLVYFADGKPDDYRYCLKQEGPHVTYHRYTPEDFADFFSE